MPVVGQPSRPYSPPGNISAAANEVGFRRVVRNRVARERRCRPGIALASHRRRHRAAAGIHNRRFECREITRLFRRRRYGRSERRSGAQAEPFPTEEPEGFVAAIVQFRHHQRTTRIRAKLVLRKRRPFLSRFVQEKVVGVEHLVSKIFVRFAMQAIRSGLWCSS